MILMFELLTIALLSMPLIADLGTGPRSAGQFAELFEEATKFSSRVHHSSMQNHWENDCNRCSDE